jgi:hypothetical protein
VSDQPCPGRSCNGRYWAATDAYRRDLAAYDPLNPETSRPEPPGPDIIWGWGDPVWCSDCQALISLHLAQLDTLAALLAAEADGHRDAGEQEKGGKRGAGSAPPSPSPAADDLDELARMLAAWEAIYRTLKGWPSPPPRGDLASRETERIAWLSRHLRGILASDIAADFGAEVLQWHRGMARQAKAGVRTLRLPLRCPGRNCGWLTLTWTEGSDRVECGNPDCGLIMSRTEYDAEVERVATAAARGEWEEPAEGAA